MIAQWYNSDGPLERFRLRSLGLTYLDGHCPVLRVWPPNTKLYFSWNMCFVRPKDFLKKLKTSQLLHLVLKLIPKLARKKEYGYWIGPMESFEKYFWLGYTICDFWMFVCSKIRPRKQMIIFDFRILFSCSFILTFWKNDKIFSLVKFYKFISSFFSIRFETACCVCAYFSVYISSVFCAEGSIATGWTANKFGNQPGSSLLQIRPRKYTSYEPLIQITLILAWIKL